MASLLIPPTTFMSPTPIIPLSKNSSFNNKIPADSTFKKSPDDYRSNFKKTIKWEKCLMILKTSHKNIVLRSLREKDAKILFQLTDENRDWIRPWLPWVDRTRTWKDTLAFIRKSQKDQAEKRAMNFGIWKGNQLAGCMSHNELNWINRNAELGYWIGKRYAGQG